METTDLTFKLLSNSALIVVTVIMGFILHKTGSPYNNLLFNVHKLLTVGFVILIVKKVISHLKFNDLDLLFLILITSSAIALITLMASGGFMSLNKHHKLMLTIHQVSTVIFLGCTTGIFYIIYIKH